MSTTTPTRGTTAQAVPSRWGPFRSLLEQQRGECMLQHELALADTVTSVPDPVAVTRSAHLLRTIQDIDAALRRIEAGTYGRCTFCGKDIPEERLEFRPFAAGCVSCQERAA